MIRFASVLALLAVGFLAVPEADALAIKVRGKGNVVNVAAGGGFGGAAVANVGGFRGNVVHSRAVFASAGFTPFYGSSAFAFHTGFGHRAFLYSPSFAFSYAPSFAFATVVPAVPVMPACDGGTVQANVIRSSTTSNFSFRSFP